MIHTDDIEQMLVEIVMGKPPSLDTPEANEMREKLRKEVAEIQARGFDIDIPTEIPDVDPTEILDF